MLSKPIPRWILVGGFALAAIAGGVNAVGFLGLHHQAIAHMSGPLTLLSNEAASGNGRAVMAALGLVFSFFGGCALSAAIIGPSALKLRRSYGAVMILEGVLLGVAWWLLRRNLNGGEYVAAIACGLQNAMASSYSGAVIRTTHMTGMVTDLGIAFGHLLRRESFDRRRVGLYSVLLSGFVIGGVLGSYGFTMLGFNILLLPSVIVGTSGTCYLLVAWQSERRESATAWVR